MAITAVRRRLGYDYRYALGELAPRRNFSEYYWVYSDTKAENPEAVRTAVGLPQIGDLHTSDIGCQVDDIGCRRDEDHPNRWDVEIHYSNDIHFKQKDKPTDVEDSTRISIRTRQGQRLIDRRIDGSAILNSAGDLIEGLVVPWNAMTIVIEQFVIADPNFYATSMWANAINSATWRGVPQYFAQIDELSYTEAIREGVNGYNRVVSVKLAHPDQDPKGFRTHVADAGLREKVTGPKWKHIRDDTTQLPVSKPVLLNGSGAKLAIGGTPVYFNASPYPELNFATLGI